jgi:hypothetical protein
MANTFATLTCAIKDVFNKFIYDQIIECLKGAGFVSKRLIKDVWHLTLHTCSLAFTQ